MLVALPRPVLPIAHRIRGAEHIPLAVRALRSGELGEAHDATGLRLPAQLVTAALVLDGGGPAFDAPEQVMRLPELDLLELGVAVGEALRTISPNALTSDTGSWEEVLAKGCVAPTNAYDAIALGGCLEVSWGMGRKAVHVVHRPDLWFGVPQRELLDCHWLAYYAAVRASWERRKRE
jgi:hypothetical protein